MDRFRRKLSNKNRLSNEKKTAITSTKTASAIASVCAALIPTVGTLRSTEPLTIPFIQNYLLIWLDINSDKQSHHNYRDTIRIFRHIINTVYTFTQIDECVKFIKSIDDTKIFLILSGTLSQTSIPFLHNLSQIYSIYTMCENKLEHDLWTYKWPKIRGTVTDISLICEGLREGIDECDRNLMSISFINLKENKSDEHFLHIFVLKEIVTKIKSSDLKDFLLFYQKLISGNTLEQRNVEKFERDYRNDGPIWWYTSQCFLYSILNHALNIIDIEILIQMGFFIRDLYEQITQIHSIQALSRKNSNTLLVYRGQGITQKDFDQLKQYQEDRLIAFNNFLFTSKNRQVSLNFAYQSTINSNLFGILFVITIDRSIKSIPFANIRDSRCNQTDEDILFPIQSIFQIDQIKQLHTNNDRVWQVDLSLIDHENSQYQSFIEYIQEKTFANRQDWCRWSEFFIDQNQYDKAEQVCQTVLQQTLVDEEKSSIFYQFGLIKYHQENYSEAYSYYNLSLNIRLKFYTEDHLDLAECYHEIGLVCQKLNRYSNAISTLEKALIIYEKILPKNDPILADCMNNIGRMAYQLGDYSKSILFYEKTLEIKSINQTEIIAIYNNLALVYEKQGEFKKAIESFEKILDIFKQNSSNESSLKMTSIYNNIGSIYKKLNDYTNAIISYEKSLTIYQDNLPLDHQDFAIVYTHIGLIYLQKHDYIKALSYLEKSHDIYRKILSNNHPDLAASYVHQGTVYEEMKTYSKALLYYKKAFEIYRTIQPINNLHLAAVYTNLGSVYYRLNEYSTALVCHQQALEIYQKYLPSIHVDIANSYSWHGDIYEKFGEFSKALESYQKALDIGQICLSNNYSCLQQWKENIETIKRQL